MNSHLMRVAAVVTLMVWGGSAAADQQCLADLNGAADRQARFTINSDTVIDGDTGLTWRRCFEGMGGADCAGGEPLRLTWPKALHHIQAVNAEGRYGAAKDWRLPNVKELYSLVEPSCADPAIDLSIFPRAPAERAWTSTPYRLYHHYSWLVDFGDGSTFNLERYKPFPFLLVRGD